MSPGVDLDRHLHLVEVDVDLLALDDGVERRTGQVGALEQSTEPVLGMRSGESGAAPVVEERGEASSALAARETLDDRAQLALGNAPLGKGGLDGALQHARLRDLGEVEEGACGRGDRQVLEPHRVSPGEASTGMHDHSLRPTAEPRRGDVDRRAVLLVEKAMKPSGSEVAEDGFVAAGREQSALFEREWRRYRMPEEVHPAMEPVKAALLEP